MRSHITSSVALTSFVLILTACQTPSDGQRDAASASARGTASTATSTAEPEDFSQGDLEAIRRKAENLVKRCDRESTSDAPKLNKCRQLYDDLQAEGNTYWTLYKGSFVAGALAGDLQADLVKKANDANDQFVLLRDLVVPQEEQSLSEPATIIAIIEIGRALYKAYTDVKQARREQVKASIFMQIDTMMFREWSDIVATQRGA